MPVSWRRATRRRAGTITRVTSDPGAEQAAEPTLTVLVYSDDRRPGPTSAGRSVAAQPPTCRCSSTSSARPSPPSIAADRRRRHRPGRSSTARRVPAGGMGICRQLKDEIYRCPPILVLIGRPQDAWLATWSRADAVGPAPARPARLAGRGRRAAARAARAAPASAGRPRRGSRPRPGRRCSTALLRGEDLDADDTAWAMGEIMAGEATPVQIAGFVVALRAKGETAARSTASCARCSTDAHRIDGARRRPSTRRHRRRPRPHGQHLHDGRDRRRRRRGDRSSSTATGRRRRRAARPTCWRRSASRSTSTARRGRACVAARPASASASRRASTPRCATPPCRARELGVPTVFNFLGPLTNPARPAAQAVGCRRRRGWRR